MSYRMLRVLVNYCFLIGVITGGNTQQLVSFLGLQSSEQNNLIHFLTSLIETEMLWLDKLFTSRREITYQFIHSTLPKLSQVTVKGPLLTPHQREKWELAFETIIQRQPVDKAISEYLHSKRTDGLYDHLQERVPCPPSSLLQSHFRMTRIPCLSDYATVFIQDREKATQFPCITAVLAHAKDLSNLSCLLPIVEFSRALSQVLSHNITRHAAAVTTVQDILFDKR